MHCSLFTVAEFRGLQRLLSFLFHGDREKILSSDRLEKTVHRILGASRSCTLDDLQVAIGQSIYVNVALFDLQLGGPQNRSLVMCRYNTRGVLTNIVTGLQNIRRVLPSFIRDDASCVSGREEGKYTENCK